MSSKVYVKKRGYPNRVCTYLDSREIVDDRMKRRGILTEKQIYCMMDCIGREIMDNRKGTTFGGRVTFTERELNYMIECAKETRKRKNW